MTAQRSATPQPLRRPPLLALPLLLLLLAVAALPAFAATSVGILNPQSGDFVSGALSPAAYTINGIAHDADQVGLVIDGGAVTLVPVKRGAWEYVWSVGAFADASSHTIVAVGYKKGLAQTTTAQNLTTTPAFSLPLSVTVTIDKSASPNGAVNLFPGLVDSALYLNTTTIGSSISVQYRAIPAAGKTLASINYLDNANAVVVTALDGKSLNQDGPGATDLRASYIFSAISSAPLRTLTASFTDNTPLTSNPFTRHIIADDTAPTASLVAAVNANITLGGVASPAFVLTGFAQDVNGSNGNALSGIADVKVLARRVKDEAGLAVSDNFLVIPAQLANGANVGSQVTWQAVLPPGTLVGTYDFDILATDNAGNQTTKLSSANINQAGIVVNLVTPTATLNTIKNAASVDVTGGIGKGTLTFNISAATATGNIAAYQIFDTFQGVTTSASGGAIVPSPATGSITNLNVSPAYNTATGLDGLHAYTLVVVDSQGNTTTTAPKTVTIDNASASGAFTAPASAALVSGTVALTGTVSDNLLLKSWALTEGGVALPGMSSKNYTIIDNVASDTFSYSLDTTALTAGMHTFTLTVNDQAGNTPFTTTLTLRVANTPPTITPTAPASGAFVSNPVAISGTVNDPLSSGPVQWNVFDGLASVPGPLSLNGGLFPTPQTGNFTNLNLPVTLTPGQHTLVFVAESAAGVFSVGPQATLIVNVDDTAPNAPAFTAPASGALLGVGLTVVNGVTTGPGVTTVAITGTASETSPPAGNALTTHVFVDGSEITPAVTGATFSFTWNISTFPNTPNDGLHTITAYTINSSGKQSTVTSRTVTVDNTAPALAFTAPAAGSTAGGKVFAVSFSVSDAHISAWTLKDAGNNTISSGTTNGSFTANWNTTLAGAASPLTLLATDTLNNANTITRAFTINNAPPTIAVTPLSTSAAIPTPVADPVLVSVTVSDPTTSGTVSWNAFVDNTAPDTTSATLLTTGTRKVFAAAQCGNFSNLTLPALLGQGTLTNGAHSITFVAQNVFGVYSAPQTYYVNFDNTTPNAPAFTAPAASAYLSGLLTPNFAITGTASETSAPAGTVLTTHVFVDGREITPAVAGATFSFSWTLLTFPTTPNDGLHTLSAYTVNSNGKQSATVSRMVTVDNILPTLTVICPADGAVVAAGTPLVGVISDANPSLNAASVHFNYSYGATTGTLPVTLDATGRTASAVIPSQFAGKTVALSLTATDLANNSNTSPLIEITVSPALNALNRVDATILNPADGATLARSNSLPAAQTFVRGSFSVFGTVSPNNAPTWTVNLYNTADLANPAAVPVLTIGSGSGAKNIELLGSATTLGVPDGSYYLRLDITAGGTTTLGTVLAGTAAVFVVDNIAPAIPTTDGGGVSGTFFNNATPKNLTGTATDANIAATYILVDNALFPNSAGTPGGTVTQMTTGLAEGVHMFSIVATDKAGNRTVSSPAVSFTIDTINPVVTITSPQNLTTTTVGAQIVGVISDTNPTTDVTKVHFSYNGVQDATPVTLDVTGRTVKSTIPAYALSLPGATTTVTLTALDKAGNPGSDTITITVNNPTTGLTEIDTTGQNPADGTPIALRSPATGSPQSLAAITSYLRGNFNVFGTISSIINGGVLQSWTVDLYDTTTNTLVRPVGNGTTAQSNALLGTASTSGLDETHAYLLRLDVVSSTGPVMGTTGNGTAAAIVVDNTAPVVTADTTAPFVNGTFFNNASPKNLTGTATDANIAATYVLVDNALFPNSAGTTGGAVTQPTTGISEGFHTFNIVGVDKAGNRSVSSPTDTFTIDNTKPVATLTAPTAGSYVSGLLTTSIPVTGSITDANFLNWALTDSRASVLTPASSTTTQTVNSTLAVNTSASEGAHTLTLNATDKAANMAIPAVVMFTVDNTPPVVAFNGLTPAEGTFIRAPFTVQAALTDANPQQLQLILVNPVTSAAGVAETGLTPPVGQTTLSKTYATDGIYQFQLRGTDLAGNTDTTKNLSGVIAPIQSRHIVLDSVAPVIASVTATPSTDTGTLSTFADDASTTKLSILAVGGSGVRVSALITDRGDLDPANTVQWAIVLYTLTNGVRTAEITLGVSGGGSVPAPVLFQAPGQSIISAPLPAATLANGHYLVEVVAIDKAGNISPHARRELIVSNGTGVGGLPSASLLAFASPGIPMLTPTLFDLFNRNAGSLLNTRIQSAAGVTNAANLNYPNPNATGMYDQYGILFSAAGTLPDSNHRPLQTFYTNTEFIVEASVYQSVNATLSEFINLNSPVNTPNKLIPSGAPIPSLSSAMSNPDNPNMVNLDSASAPFTYSLSRTVPGFYQFVLIAADAANKSAIPALLNIVLDRTAPTLAPSLPVGNQVYSPGDILVVDFTVNKDPNLQASGRVAPIRRIKQGVNAPYCKVFVTPVNNSTIGIGPNGLGGYTLLTALDSPNLQDAPANGAALVTGDAFSSYRVRWQIRLFSQYYSHGVTYALHLNGLQDVAGNAVPEQVIPFKVGN